MSVVAMKKLNAFVCKSDADAVTKALMKMRCVQIRAMSPENDPAASAESVPADVASAASLTVTAQTQESGLSRYDGDPEKTAAEKRLAAVNNALAPLYKRSQRKKSLVKPFHEVNYEKFRTDGRSADAARAVEETNAITERQNQINAEKQKLLSSLDTLSAWKNYDLSLSFTNTRSASIALGAFPAGIKTAKIEEKLNSECGACFETVSAGGNGVCCAVIYYTPDEEDVFALLSQYGFVRANFKDYKGTAAEERARINERLGALEDETAGLEAGYSALAEKLDDIEILSDMTATDLAAAVGKQNYLQTESTVAIFAWIPEPMTDKVSKKLDSFACAYEISDPEKDETPPVLLKNNRFATPFEWVLGMYSYPMYGTFDPTFIMSIFYFVIFGLMFADVGYGLVLVLGCFGAIMLMKPKKGMRNFLMMFGICGIASILAGILFGGYLGDLPTAVMKNFMGNQNPPELALWFNPIAEPMKFLAVSLVIGAIHLLTGMGISFYNLCREGKVLDAIFDVGSWYVLFAGIGLIFVSKTVGIVVLVAGILMLVCTQGRHEKNFFMKIIKGVGSLYNLVSYISDLLSYSRILALGLAAGVIASVVNILATMMGPTAAGIVLFILIIPVGHVMNLVINVLGTFVHTSRLQYIEFFNKFYKDGGVPFQPMVPSDKYSVDPLGLE